MINQKARHVFARLQNLRNELNQLPGLLPVTVNSIELNTLPSLEQIVTDDELYQLVVKLFRNGHHSEAVKKAFLLVNNLVKNLAPDKGDGAPLMQAAFSPKTPIIKINAFSTKSEIDEQNGYKDIFTGVMTGIRNPRSHEHDWEDTEERALQLLSLANHLIIRIRSSSTTEASS
jgi:uncharacterized protein (TIGR02391 family)